jgi:hypothetical protein
MPIAIDDLLQPDRDPTADERRDVLDALRCQIDAANAGAEPAERVAELADVVRLGLALAAGAADDETVAGVRATLEDIGGGLDPTERADLIGWILGAAAAFVHAPQVWAHEHPGGEGDLLRLAPVESRARAFLEQLYVATRLHAAAARLGVDWLAPLLAGLAAAVDSGHAALRDSPLSLRLWPMRRQAERFGLADAVPALANAVCAVAGPGPAALPAPRAQERAFELLRRRDPRDPLVREIASAAVHGDLAPGDLALLRRLVADEPQPWAIAHRDAFRKDGFRAHVCLERIEDSARDWRAPAIFQADAADIAPAAVLPETQRFLLPPPAAVPSQATGRTGEPDALPVEIRRLALAVRRIPLAGAEIALFGDGDGFWLRARAAGQTWKVRCDSGVTSATGWHAQFPIVHARDQQSETVPTRELLPLRAFRPGPLRPLLAAAGANVDRACSPRAYVVSVGESILRNLLGLDFKGSVQRAVEEAALRAGLRSGARLLESLQARDALAAEWIGALPLSDRAGALAGGPAVRDLLGGLDRLAVEQLGSGDDGLLGAEVDALMSAGRGWRPVAGDRVLLIATATCSGILAARIVQAWLRAHVPAVRTRVAPCTAMRQPETLGSGRFELPEEPIVETYGLVDGWLGRLLTRHAADVLLVVSGGVKWQMLPLAEAAAARRVPILYKATRGAPIIFRWDLFRPGAMVAAPRDSARAGRLAVTVGVSLLRNYRRDHARAAERRQVSADELSRWASQRGPGGSAELTGFDAWRRRYGPPTGAGPVEVALIRSRSSAAAYDEGQVCAGALAGLLERAGARVAVEPSWDVPDLNEWRMEEDAAHLKAALLEPVARCLDAGTERTDVLISGGQKLTCAMTSLIARGRGCRSFFAPEGDAGGEPRIWLVREGRGRDEPVAQALAGSDLYERPVA